MNATKNCAAFVLLSLVLILISVFLFFFDFGAEKIRDASNTVDTRTSPYPIVVIDAGHGAPDGGCSGADGTQEKDLNLIIAKNVYSILRAANIPCVMTRTEDELLYDRFNDLEDYTGKKKIYDVKNRLRIAESYGSSILVSIHMNAFPDGKYSGLQVYYSDNNKDSIKLAEKIQNITHEYLQKENSRGIKRAGSSIYLLDRIQNPGVLIECGFLSNPQELELLKTEKYQKELSVTLSCAIINFLHEYINQA